MKQDPKQIIDAFIDASVKEYDTHARAAGFLGCILYEVMQELPENKRHPIIRTLKETTCRITKQKPVTTGSEDYTASTH
jgi:hypothetical protein